jgi:hypothetical protein
MKTKYWLLLLPLAVAYGQSPKNFEESVRAAMEPSLLKQRDSAKKQAATVSKKISDPADSSFFTVPFASQSQPVADQETLAADEPEVAVEQTNTPPPVLDVFDLKEDEGTGTWLLKVLGAFNSNSVSTDREGEILRKLRPVDYKPAKILEVPR